MKGKKKLKKTNAMIRQTGKMMVALGDIIMGRLQLV